ncbi:hypothetical protein G3N64_25320 [Burkholderia sp. Ac-20344]|nr:hypothetical protein [Burkholderia sp. Ac-20344]
MQMIGERGATFNSAEWPARRLAYRTIHATRQRAQWISDIRPDAARTCVVGAQRFARPPTPLAEDIDKPLAPPGSALLTHSMSNTSVF